MLERFPHPNPSQASAFLAGERIASPGRAEHPLEAERVPEIGAIPSTQVPQQPHHCWCQGVTLVFFFCSCFLSTRRLQNLGSALSKISLKKRIPAFPSLGKDPFEASRRGSAVPAVREKSGQHLGTVVMTAVRAHTGKQTHLGQ